MSLPGTLFKIAEKFFQQQRHEDNKLTEEERISLTEQLIQAYEKLERSNKKNVLIPADGRFLKETAISKEVLFDETVEYFFLYNWPTYSFDGSWYKCILQEGEKYDRIGGEDGTYLAPLKKDGMPESYLARAIPYYIPEENISDSPSYHCYIVKATYAGEKGTVIKKGKIAQAFRNKPKDGGGTQIKLPIALGSLKGVYFCECKST